MTALVYKLVRPAEWAALAGGTVFPGTPDDLRDGFLHFSTSGQLCATAQKHFADADRVLLLTVATDDLGAALKWEVSRGGEKFPHLYDALSLALVKEMNWLTRGPDGAFVFPPDIS